MGMGIILRRSVRMGGAQLDLHRPGERVLLLGSSGSDAQSTLVRTLARGAVCPPASLLGAPGLHRRRSSFAEDEVPRTAHCAAGSLAADSASAPARAFFSAGCCRSASDKPRRTRDGRFYDRHRSPREAGGASPRFGGAGGMLVALSGFAIALSPPPDPDTSVLTSAGFGRLVPGAATEAGASPCLTP
jgi:hypothetical protein